MTITRAQVESCLTSTNVKAAIRLLRAGESWNDDAHPGSEYDEQAYRVRYHPTRFPTLFDGFDDHPRIYEALPDGSGRSSSAAGCGQITASTWDDMRRRYPGVFGPTFRPWDQEACIVVIMYDLGALDLVIDGNIAAFLPLLAKRWASMPSSPLQDGGRKLTLAKAYDVFRQWGGGVPVVIDRATDDRDDAPAPIEDRSRPASPEDVERITGTPQETPQNRPLAGATNEAPMAPLAFVLPLLQSLFEAFSPVLRAKVTRALDKQTGDPAVSSQVADSLMGIVAGIAGQAGVPLTTPAVPGAPAPVPAAVAADPVLAVAAVKSSPALLAQAEQEIDAYLDKIAPMLDKVAALEAGAWKASEESMDRAAARASAGGNDDWMTKALVGGMLLMAGVLILFILGIAVAQVWREGTPSTEVWAAVTGLVGAVFGIATAVFAYRFGTSRSSAAKDVAIEHLTRRA